MTYFRSIALAVAISGASLLTACTNAPAMPMGSTPASNMATPERMAAMDGQMKTMRDMHTKMMNAKTPEERQALMGEHMKAMQGGMDMMKGIPLFFVVEADIYRDRSGLPAWWPTCTAS